jgi:hypothetical protein
MWNQHGNSEAQEIRASLTYCNMGVRMRKPGVLLLILVFIGLMFSPALVLANPNWAPSEIVVVPPPANINLIFDFVSPTENALYEDGKVNVCFSVRVVDPDALCGSVYATGYQGDWMQASAQLSSFQTKIVHFRQYNFTVGDVPFGEHTLNITAHTQGRYMKDDTECIFEIDKTASVNFFVHANPIITFLSDQNANSSKSSFPLKFTVDHAVSEVTYSFDGQEPLPLSGNITFADLANGRHNVTIYATDEYGYSGIFETLFFNVNAPEFPVVPFVAVSAIVVVSTVAGVMLYFKKRKRLVGNRR